MLDQDLFLCSFYEPIWSTVKSQIYKTASEALFDFYYLELRNIAEIVHVEESTSKP